MTFLTPITALIAAAIAVPALVALYFLKLRRRQLPVASTLLWKKAIQDMQVNAPFQRLRKNLLLLLQLLILAALLIAMARPTTHSLTAPGQRVVIVLDHSASMNATDGNNAGHTRLDEAKRTALELIDSLGDQTDDAAAGAMVVSFAQQARVVQPFTSDFTLLRDAVRRIEPTDQRSALGSALRLIEPFALEAEAAGSDGSALAVYVLSDGRIHHDQAAPLSLKGADLRFVTLGQPRSDADPTLGNVGLISFSARRDFERPQIVQVFARLANDGTAPVDANVTLRLDGNVQRVQAARIPPRDDEGPGTTSLQFDFVQSQAAMVELSHDHADLLAADDAARLMLAPARRLRVLLVTPANAFLQRVIESVGVRDLVVMTPDKYENQDPQRLRRGGWDPSAAIGATSSAADGFDVIVYDRYAAPHVPPVSSITFAAAPPIDDLELVRTSPIDDDAESNGNGDADDADETATPDTAQVILDWDRNHPLMRHVVLDDVILGDAGRFALPADAAVLAVGQHGPIMAELRAQGRQHIVTSFDILQTNWPLYVSFPVFIRNAIPPLGLGGLYDEAGHADAAGDVAVVPATQLTGEIDYRGPTPLHARIADGRAILPVFTRVGVYRTADEVDPPFDRIPVNLLDPLESDLLPADQLQVGTTAVEARSQARAVRREVWYWFIWAALAVLMIEWLVYTRRMHL